MMVMTESKTSSKALSRGSSVEDGDAVGDGDEDDQDGDSTRASYLKSELKAAVDKIYELRDIIRGLESKLELAASTESHQNEQLRQLRLSLEESLVSQQLVSQELEQFRSNTNDQELVEHIRTLEE